MAIRISVLLLFMLLPLALRASTGGYEVGDKAADFRLKNVDGSMVSMADYPAAKGFIVIFTCNHCPYSVAYEDRIIALDRKYRPQGYPVIAINPNDPAVQPADGFEEMQDRAKEKDFTFPYLFDDGQKVYPKYGATRTPHVFILQKSGGDNIVRYIGTIDDNHGDEQDVTKRYVELAVDALLAGGTPDPAETKAIGCSIKTQKK
jgi:peroxiredoxin